MTTVTGYTAERMQEIEDQMITAAAVVGGHLMITRHDLTQFDAGAVVGPAGPQGVPGAMPSFAGYDEPWIDLGNVAGAVNLDFNASNVWRINPTGAVTLAFQNLPAAGFVTPGTLIVANSSFAITWPAGTKFPSGVAPALSGETIISMLARPAGVTVGVAWSAVA